MKVLALIAATTGLNLLLLPWIGYRAVADLYLFVVLIAALFLGLGRGPLLLAAGLSGLLWNFLFIPPRFTFRIYHPEDVLMFSLYFVIAITVGSLTARIRQQEMAARHREERTAALYTLAREVSSALSMDDVLATAVKQIARSFDADIAFILATPEGALSHQAHPASTLYLDEKEMSVAAGVFQDRRPAGGSTDRLSMAQALYLPLLSPGGPVGVMGIRLHPGRHLTGEQEKLLETFASQVALAVGRELQVETARRNQMLVESERLSRTLLSSISHELRTPITTITGAASSLLEEQTVRDPTTRHILYEDIFEAGLRLDRLVKNLLNMTRVETGRLQLDLDWFGVEDLFNMVTSRLKKELTQHRLVLDVPAGLPPLKVDYALMEQVLSNLIHNATIYTPPGTTICLTARLTAANNILISVSDNGPGLPAEELPRVFDKFYRGPHAPPGGTGLGLSICQGFVAAHGGRISVMRSPQGGLSFQIFLPLSNSSAASPEDQP